MSKANTKKKVLIVDDDENVRILCERELQKEGYITHVLSSGAEALRFLKKNRQVDLIFWMLRCPH